MTASASCCPGRASAAEAEAEFRKALAILQELADDNPVVAEFRGRLAGSHHSLGILLRDRARPSESEAEVRTALALFDALPSRSGEQWFETACGRAVLSGLAGEAGSGISAA